MWHGNDGIIKRSHDVPYSQPSWVIRGGRRRGWNQIWEFQIGTPPRGSNLPTSPLSSNGSHSLLSLLCLGFIQRMCLYIKQKKNPLKLPKVTLHMNTQSLLQYKTLVHLYFFLPFSYFAMCVVSNCSVYNF